MARRRWRLCSTKTSCWDIPGIGELALGHLSDRDEVIALLEGLSRATVATTAVLTLTAVERLNGSGIGYVEAQLIASTLLIRDSASGVTTVTS